MSYRKCVTWTQDDVQVTSFGNGAAYLVRLPDCRELWVEDADATDLRYALHDGAGAFCNWLDAYDELFVDPVKALELA